MTTIRTAHHPFAIAAPGKAFNITLWTLQVLVALAFVAAAAGKLLGSADMIALFDSVGVGQWFRYVTGLLELLGALLLSVPGTAAFGSVLLAGVMAVAVVARATVLHTAPTAPGGLLALAALTTLGRRSGMGLHPHSGIATVSYLFEGSVRYEDSTGATGVLTAGGVEWFKAARGAWHGGGPGDTGRARGFQLWLALPPDQELGAVENVYLAPDAVARDGPARVLVGTHGGATSPLKAAGSLNYLAVRLRAGESWRYQPAIDHTVGWVAVSSGRLRVPESVDAGELAIFESSTDAIAFQADADSE